MGGVARRATALADLKRRHRDVPVLVLETGNSLRQSENLDDPSNRWILEAFNALGVQGVNVDEPDLRRLERLQGLGRVPAQLRSEYISTCLDPSTSLQFHTRPYALFTLKPAAGGEDVRVGVLAVSGSSGVPGAIPFQGPAVALKRTLPELEGKADLIVLLTRLQDPEIADLARQFPSIGVIVNGSAVGEGREFPRLGNTVAVESSHSGIGIGILEVTWDGGGRVTGSKNEMMLLPPPIPDSPGLVDIVEIARRDVGSFEEREAKKTAPPAVPSIFAGADTCKTCHARQFKVWSGSRHAHAIETLARKGTQFSKDCVPCHVTGFGADRGFINMLRTPNLAGVQCEACHGASADHVRSPQTTRPGIGPVQKVHRRVRKEFCLRCHTPENSPNFSFEGYWPKIAH